MSEKGTVLIVDDSIALTGLISDMLKSEQFSCYSVESGEQAIEFLETIKPDLILLDRTLPGINGFEVCKLIKNNKDLKKIPIIFLTATNDVNDKVEGFKIGAVDYITKPFQKEELLARVNSHIELYKLSKLHKEQADILKESEKDLKELNATKDKFFSIIAHDLKGPMNNLLGLTRLIKIKCDEGDIDTLAELVEHLYNTAEVTNELLVTLLDWASVQRGKMPYKPQQINLFQVITESVQQLSGNFLAKNITVTNLVQEHTLVKADMNMLQAILRNLLSNAIKFTPKGESIKVFNGNSNGTVQICVSDSGVGMDSKKVKNLFKIGKVHSTYGTEGEFGTGLGLILCKEFVEKHNGNIWVESELNKGTNVWFSLPVG